MALMAALGGTVRRAGRRRSAAHGQPEPVGDADRCPDPATSRSCCDRVVALLAPALDRAGCRAGRRDPRPGRAHRGRADAGARRPGSSASTATPTRSRSPGSGCAPSATGSPPCTRSTTSCPRSWPTSGLDERRRACSSTSASPRCSSTCASAASPTPRTPPLDMRMDAGRGPHRRRRAQHLLRAPTWPGSCATTARSGSPAGSPQPSCASAPTRAVHHLGPPRRAALRDDPGAGPAHRRPPRQAHLPGAADRGQRRAGGAAAGRSRPPSTPSASAAGWSSSPTTRWRTGWSSGPSPPPCAPTCPTTCPFVPAGHEPALRLVTRGAEKADAEPRSSRTRGPPRSGCAPSNGSRAIHPRQGSTDDKGVA